MEGCRIHGRRVFDNKTINTVAIVGVVLLSSLVNVGTLHAESVPLAGPTPTPTAALLGCNPPNERHIFNEAVDKSAWSLAGARNYKSDAERVWFYDQMRVEVVTKKKDQGDNFVKVWSPVNVYQMHDGDVLCLPQKNSQQDALEIENTPVVGITPTLTTTLHAHGTITPTLTVETNQNLPPEGAQSSAEGQNTMLVGGLFTAGIIVVLWLGIKSRG